MKKINIKNITKKYLNELYTIKEDDSVLQNLMGKFIDTKNTIFDKEYFEKMNKSLEDYLKEKNKTKEEITDEDLSDLKIVGDINFSGGNFDSNQKKMIKSVIDGMNEIGITNPYTQIGILSVIDKESGFKALKEFGYSTTPNSSIRRIFGSRAAKYTDDELTELKKSYEDFFEAMYGKDSGTNLGNTEPGDGWRYVGRGLNGLTGRGNYRKYGQMIGMNLEGNPELVEDPDVAAKIAIAFFTKGKDASLIPEFTDKEEAAKYFADINAGGVGSEGHRGNAITSSKKFDVDFSIT